MSYRRTKLILPPKGKPLDKRDLILRQVQWEEASIPSPTPETPRYEAPRRSKVPFSVGMWNFIRQFRP